MRRGFDPVVADALVHALRASDGSALTRTARCGTFVAPMPTTTCTPWLRPLLALDSADGAAAAWAVAAQRTGGRCAVAVLHAVPRAPSAAWCAVTPGCPTMTLPVEDPEAHADALLRRIAAELPDDVSVTMLACQGRRADHIARWAQRFCSDGVVVACGGGRLVRRVQRQLGGVEVLAA